MGHAKSIVLNSGLARRFGGKFNLRFDDTNPEKEEQEYVDSIIDDVKWLGGDFEDRLFYASDYFGKMYEWAEALVKKGMPFRVAYKHVGALVKKCQEQGLPLSKASVELAKSIDPAMDADALSVLEPAGAVARKRSAGSTGPESVAAQLNHLAEQSRAIATRAKSMPTLAQLFERVSASAL